MLSAAWTVQGCWAAEGVMSVLGHCGCHERYRPLHWTTEDAGLSRVVESGGPAEGAGSAEGANTEGVGSA